MPSRTTEHSGRGKPLRTPARTRVKGPRHNKSRRPTMNKKAFVRQRQGVVETKSRTHEEISSAGPPNQYHISDPTVFHAIPLTDACHFIHPESFLSLNQGFGEMDMLGQTLFAKALKMKINLKLPFGANAITTPFNLYLVHGTVQAPNFTGSTTPQAPSCSRSDIRNHIENRVKDYFDERQDKLRFIPKTGVTVDIQGYKKILNDKNTSWLSESSSAPSPYKKSVTWQLNKKVKYEQGFPAKGSPGPPLDHQVHFYPNYTRLPFCLIYMPQYATLAGANASIQCAYNDCFWFTDS